MLYQIYEWQRRMLLPAENLVKNYAAWMQNPLNPMAMLPGAQAMAGIWEGYANTSAEYGSTEFKFIDVNGKTIEVDNTVVETTPFCHYRRFYCTEDNHKKALAKVALISPISGNYSVVLNDVVSCLLPHAEVLITDWIDARDIPKSDGIFGLDENITHIINLIEKEQPEHLLSFSQSCNPTLIALALLAKKQNSFTPKTLSIIGGPMDTRINKGILNGVSEEYNLDWVKQNLIMEVPIGYAGVGRKVFPGFLQHAGFMGLHWDRQAAKQWEQMASDVYGDQEQSNKMKRNAKILRSVMDIPAEHYLDSLNNFFLQHSLADGNITALGEKVDVSAIKNTAILVVEGERDDLCPVGQTKAVFDWLTNLPKAKQKYLLAENSGHFGLVGGRQFKQAIFPVILDWFKAN